MNREVGLCGVGRQGSRDVLPRTRSQKGRHVTLVVPTTPPTSTRPMSRTGDTPSWTSPSFRTGSSGHGVGLVGDGCGVRVPEPERRGKHKTKGDHTSQTGHVQGKTDDNKRKQSTPNPLSARAPRGETKTRHGGFSIVFTGKRSQRSGHFTPS